MADETNVRVIKTKIVIRNDSLANFQANPDLMLLKGEMAIAISDDVTKASRIKIGDGVHTWGELPFVNFATDGGGGTVDFIPDNKVLTLTTNNILTLIGLDTATPGQSFKISEDGSSIVWFESASSEEVTANTTLINQVNESLTNNYYTKTETDGLVAKVFKFKGTKSSYAELEAVEDPQVGDVWTVKEAGKEANLYVYAENEDGTGYWEDFPLTIDLSNYVLVSDFNTLSNKVTEIENTVNEVSEKVDTIDTNLTNLDTKVAGIETSVTDLDTKVTDIDTSLTTVSGKVDTLEGNVVSLTDDIGTLSTDIENLTNRVADLEDNAGGGGDTPSDPVNAIRNVKINGKNLTVNPTDKSVNIPIGGSDLGVVKNYTGDASDKPVNVVVIDENGVMSIPNISFDSLVQDDEETPSAGDKTIISGGGPSDF